MSGARFDPEAIRALAAILTESGLTEIEVSDQDSRIRVVRAHAPAAVQTYAVPPQAAPAPGPLAAPPPAPEDDASHPGAVTSPMVGVAFLAPDPGSPAYVAVGQSVQAGQTLLLIEAMKTFNQIKAPRAGVVTRILVSSGVPVEYGEVLMVVE